MVPSAAATRATAIRGAVAGAFGALALALGDVGWALRGHDGVDAPVLLAAAALESALLLPPSTAIGAAALLLAMRVRPRLRRLGARGWAGLGGASIGAMVLAVTLREREIDWLTVDPRLALLPALTLGAVGLALLRRRPSPITPVPLLLAAVATWWLLPAAHARALRAIGEHTRVGAPLLARAMRLSDGDGDGAGRWLCGERCDCDDDDDARHHAAEEQAGDGVDQDCDGVDLAPEEGQAIAALFTPTPPAPARPTARPDVLLLTVDTLRADHLGTYGYERDTSPRIDAWARTAVVFEQARATGPSTRFSIPPLLAGRYITEIGRNGGEWPVIYQSETLFGERMAQLGYATAAFHSIRYLRPYFGLNQGFEHWSCDCLDVRGPPLFMTCADFITDEALAWLDARHTADDRPLLMWAYYGDPHSRYVEHEGYSIFGSDYKDLYDGEIRFVDHHIGRLLDGIAQRRPGRELVVVLHADHGEGLDHDEDHGALYHSNNLYDELVRVPLIISGPGIAPGRVAEPVSLVDFVPTMLDLLGEPVDPALRGVSLVPWLRGEPHAPHPPVMFEKHRAIDEPQHGMVLWPYKVIRTPATGTIDIYDLASDPGERRDLAGTLDAAERRRLVGALVHWHRRVRVPFEEQRRH